MRKFAAIILAALLAVLPVARAIVITGGTGTQNFTAPAGTGAASDPGFANVGPNGVYLGNYGGNFWVLNKRTGERIARLDIPSGTQTGIPMTYLHEGRQYVVFATTAGGQPSEIVAYALPK